jgi:molybdopterin/thiamine biosynthesis adenylyltransferase
MGTKKIADIFQRSLVAHLPPSSFSLLQNASVFIGGLGGGSNIAELLARKGVGRLTIADLDVFEPHNVRQRGSLSSTWGRAKVDVMTERLLDINPNMMVTPVREGVTLDNVAGLVRRSTVVVDMLDFHALKEKVALYQAARAQGKVVVTTPSVVNGAVLYVFTPEGPTFEEFFGYEPSVPPGELALRFLRRLITHYPTEAPEEVYQAAARGERTIPLDAVGVDQAAVLAAVAVENLILGRQDRVVTIPRGIQVDLSDPAYLVRIVDFTPDFGGPA